MKIPGYVARMRVRARAKQTMPTIDDAYDLYDAGALDQAAETCRSLLGADPASFSVLYLLGTILGEQLAFGDAIACLEQAIVLRPDVKVARFNLASVLAKSGAFDAALLHMSGVLQIAPDDIEARLVKASCHVALGQRALAANELRRVLEIDPSSAEALRQLVAMLIAEGQKDEALAGLDRLMVLDHGTPETCFSRGILFLDLERFDEAFADFTRALALKPDYAAAFSNRGLALAEMKRHEEALVDFERALALKPDYVEAWCNRGRSLGLLERFEEALRDQSHAIAIDPTYPFAYFNRGIAHGEKQDFDAARADYDKAITCKADYAEAYWNKALLELYLGRMEIGWPLYEWRLKTAEYRVKLKHPQPMLASLADAKGKIVLVHWEQGLGDVIQFCRYIPMLAAAGARVLFAPQPALRQLLAQLQGPSVTMVDWDEPSLPFDRQIPLLSLPYMFGTTLDNIPSQTPYLFAETVRIAAWQSRLGRDSFKIGICWKGNPKFAGDARRSFALAQFATLASLPGVRLISLHKGEGEADVLALPDDSFRVETLGEAFDAGPGAFLDTAAVMKTVDLVITSDTSIAHVAGALGVPVWVALAYKPDFRWLHERADCPWYPTMRLFRQKVSGDWDGAFADIGRALKDLLPPGGTC
jgi:tetratricopeptide (TPR) repeat protein